MVRVDLTLRASADLGDVTRDRYTAERFYNPVYEIWSEQDSLTDLGANVTTQLFEWMNQCHVRELAVEDGIHFRFVAVATPDDQALRSAYNAISTAVETLGEDVELLLVLNEVSAGSGFAYCEQHTAFRELESLSRSVDLKILKIPFCDSDLMDYGRAHALSPLTVFKAHDRLCEEMGLSRVAARTEKRRLLAWISEVQENLQPLFADPRRPQAARAPAAQPQPPRDQTFRQEAPRQEATRQEAPRQEAPRYEVLRQEPVRHDAAFEPRREGWQSERAPESVQAPAPAHAARPARDYGRDRGYDEASPRHPSHVTDAGTLVEQLRPSEEDGSSRDRHLRSVAGRGYDPRA
jgi:hypothetical protein